MQATLGINGCFDGIDSFVELIKQKSDRADLETSQSDVLTRQKAATAVKVTYFKFCVFTLQQIVDCLVFLVVLDTDICCP